MAFLDKTRAIILKLPQLFHNKKQQTMDSIPNTKLPLNWAAFCSLFFVILSSIVICITAMNIKKFSSYFLILLILICTVLAILGIWDIIDIDYVSQKIIITLVVIFCAAAVVLFILNVLLKEKDNSE